MGEPSITCYADPRKRYSVELCKAFAKGCGGTVALDFVPRPGIAVVHGMAERQLRIMRHAEDWYEIDHAYFGRGEYHRVTHRGLWSRLQGAPNHQRLERHGIAFAKPIKRSGDVLLVAQTMAAYEADNTTLDRWLASSARKVRRYSKRYPLIRYKPVGEHRLQPTLEQILPLMWAVVTHTSSAALVALAAAVPVVITNPAFPAARLAIGFEELEQPRVPSVDERREVFAQLAAEQWTLAEMCRGDCWEALRGNR